MSQQMTAKKEKEQLQPGINDLLGASLETDLSFNDQDTGWAWVVLFASFMTYCLMGAALYAVGIIHSTLLERYEASVSQTAWAGALHTALISVAGPISSYISDKYSCRVAIVSSGLMYTVGYGLTAFAPNIFVAIVTCGIISGTAGGLAFTANMVVVGYYFKKRRNLALGLANSGSGLGLFCLAPLMQWLKENYGSFGFFILLSGIYFHLTAFGMLCFPSKLELHSKVRRKTDVRTSSKKNKCSTLLRQIKIIRHKGIFCYCLAMFNNCLGIYLLYLYFPVFIVIKGYSAIQAAFFVSLSGIFSVAGRVLSGVIASFPFVSDILLYSGSIFTVAAVSFVYPLVTPYYAGQISYFVTLGLFMGVCFVLTPSVSLKFVPVEDMATAVGLQFAFGGTGALLGPVLAGLLVDMGGTYEQVIFVAATCILLAAISGGITFWFKQRSAPKLDIILEDEPKYHAATTLES